MCNHLVSGKYAELSSGSLLEQPSCTTFRLTVQTMQVHTSDDGWFDDDLEVRFDFIVNGQLQSWIHNDLDKGPHTIDKVFTVNVPTEKSTITITVSGEEFDPTSNDDLPGFTRVFGKKDDWGVGSQTGDASNESITYTLYYFIECVPVTELAVSREALIGYARANVNKQKDKDLSETILLSASLGKLRRAGWTTCGVTDRLFIMRGAGMLPLEIERAYGSQSSSGN